MGRTGFFLRLCGVACIALLMSACSHNAYDTGDSRYSYLRTDFAEAYTNGNGALWSAITDDGDSLVFTSTLQRAWAARPDSVYRTLLYYNLQPAGVAAAATSAVPLTVEPVSVAMVYVLKPLSGTDSLALMADPVVFESAWLSRNRRYVNLGLALMTGQPATVDASQAIGLACDGVVTGNDGRRTYYYRLCHDQGNVPEYYKGTVYVSIPVSGMRAGDAVTVTIPTYDGPVVRVFRL